MDIHEKIWKLLEDKSFLHEMKALFKPHPGSKDSIKDFERIAFWRLKNCPPGDDIPLQWVTDQVHYFLKTRTFLADAVTAEPLNSFIEAQLRLVDPKCVDHLKNRFFSAALYKMRRVQPAPQAVSAWAEQNFQSFLNKKLRLPALFQDNSPFKWHLQRRLNATPGDECGLRDFEHTVTKKSWDRDSPPPPRLKHWIIQQLDAFTSVRSDLRRLYDIQDEGENPVEKLTKEVRIALMKTAPRFGQNGVDDCVNYTICSAFKDALYYDSFRGTIEQWVLGRVRFSVMEWIREQGTVVDPGSSESKMVTEDSPTPYGLAVYQGLAKHCSDEEELTLAMLHGEGVPFEEIARQLKKVPNTIKILKNAAQVSDRKVAHRQLMLLLNAAGIVLGNEESATAFAVRALSTLREATELDDPNPAIVAVSDLIAKLEIEQIAARVRTQWNRDLKIKLRKAFEEDATILEAMEGLRTLDRDRGDARGSLRLDWELWDEDYAPAEEDSGEGDEDDPEEE
jgi:hypothetical protein